jgi:hypothetical protein
VKSLVPITGARESGKEGLALRRNMEHPEEETAAWPRRLLVLTVNITYNTNSFPVPLAKY